MPPLQQPSDSTTKRWFASQASGSSLLGYGQDKGVESQLLFPPPTVMSSLGECLEPVADRLEVGSQQMPLHQLDVSKNHSLLRQLMLYYHIVGVSV